MKKYFELALVFSVVGLANASLYLDDPSYDNGVWYVSASGLFDQDAYLLLTSKDGSITNGILGDAAGAASFDTGLSAAEFAAATGMTIKGNGIAFAVATFPGEAYKTGEYLKGTCSPDAFWPFYLYFYSEVTGESGLLDIWVFPEPATMFLLGLGVMFIRRK